MRTAILAVLLTLLSAAAAHAQCNPTTEPSLDGMSQTLSGWQKFDENVVLDVNGRAAHGASALANFGAAKQDLVRMFHPDGMSIVEGVVQVPIIGPILAAATIPMAWLADGVEIVGGPFFAAKDTGDGLLHGVLWIFKGDGALPVKRPDARR